jgi:acyl-CoA synthetase (NDP forming)
LRSWPTPRPRGLQSTFVSAGNRADASGNDPLQYRHGDDRTEVVLLYLESFGNPCKFARLARVLARTKPVIAVKSGRNATPHARAAVDADIRGRGGEPVRAVRRDQDRNARRRVRCRPATVDPAGARRDRVAVIGKSTALGMLAVDACLRIADGRPVDLGVDASPEELAAAVRAALSRPDVDALVVVNVPIVATTGLAHAAALRSAVAVSGQRSPSRCSPNPVCGSA